MIRGFPGRVLSEIKGRRRGANAIGGTALVAIGAALVFRPEWLAFG